MLLAHAACVVGISHPENPASQVDFCDPLSDALAAVVFLEQVCAGRLWCVSVSVCVCGVGGGGGGGGGVRGRPPADAKHAPYGV